MLLAAVFVLIGPKPGIVELEQMHDQNGFCFPELGWGMRREELEDAVDYKLSVDVRNSDEGELWLVGQEVIKFEGRKFVPHFQLKEGGLRRVDLWMQGHQDETGSIVWFKELVNKLEDQHGKGWEETSLSECWMFGWSGGDGSSLFVEHRNSWTMPVIITVCAP